MPAEEVQSAFQRYLFDAEFHALTEVVYRGILRTGDEASGLDPIYVSIKELQDLKDLARELVTCYIERRTIVDLKGDKLAEQRSGR